MVHVVRGACSYCPRCGRSTTVLRLHGWVVVGCSWLQLVAALHRLVVSCSQRSVANSWLVVFNSCWLFWLPLGLEASAQVADGRHLAGLLGQRPTPLLLPSCQVCCFQLALLLRACALPAGEHDTPTANTRSVPGPVLLQPHPAYKPICGCLTAGPS